MADDLYRRELPLRWPVPEGKVREDCCLMQTAAPIEIGGVSHNACTVNWREDGETQEHLEQRTRDELQAYIDANRAAGQWGG